MPRLDRGVRGAPPPMTGVAPGLPGGGTWVCAVAVALVLAPASAEAESQIRVAVYAPWAGPSTADDRHALARAIERELTADGAAAKVSSYAKLGDFRKDLDKGAVDIAVVDSAVAPSLGKRARFVASWSSGQTWIVAGASSLDTLDGKTLALQAPDARSSKTLVSRLLRGQADASTWKATVGAPVTADARELVVRGKADVVIVPRRLAGATVEVASLGSFSELAIVALSSRDLSAASQLVQSAIVQKLGGAWATRKSTFPEPVGHTSLIAAKPEPPSVSVLDLLEPVELSLPDLPTDLMWIEPDAP